MTKKESDETKIAIINNNISFIQKDISEIKVAFKELSGVFITKQALEEIAKRTEERLIRLENESNLWKWLSPSLAAILGSIMTFLTIQFLINSQ